MRGAHTGMKMRTMCSSFFVLGSLFHIRLPWASRTLSDENGGLGSWFYFRVSPHAASAQRGMKMGPLVLGSWFLVLGSWFSVLGSWFSLSQRRTHGHENGGP